MVGHSLCTVITNTLGSCYTRRMSCHTWLFFVSRDVLLTYVHSVQGNTDLEKYMCHADAMRRLPLNDAERDEV